MFRELMLMLIEFGSELTTREIMLCLKYRYLLSENGSVRETVMVIVTMFITNHVIPLLGYMNIRENFREMVQFHIIHII